jgi:hypothetical protein
MDILNKSEKPKTIKLKPASIVQAGLFHFCLLGSHTVYAWDITHGQPLPEISFEVDQKSVWKIPKYSIINLDDGQSARLPHDMFGYKVELQHTFAQPLQDDDDDGFQDFNPFFCFDSKSDSKSDSEVDSGWIDLDHPDHPDSYFYRVSEGDQAEYDSSNIWD